MQSVINGYFSVKLIPTLIIATMLFAGYKEKRPYFVLRLIASTAAATALATLGGNLIYSVEDTSVRKLLSCVLTAFYFGEMSAILCFCLKCNFYESVLYIICGWSLEHISYCISVLVAYMFNFDGVLYRPYSVQYFITHIATYAVMYAAVGILFHRKGNYNLIDVEKKKLFLPSILLFTAFSVLNAYAPAYSSDSATVVFFKIYALVCGAATLCTAWGLFDSASYRYQLNTVEQLDRRRREQYEVSKDTIDLINTKCHDLKKMLSGKTGLLMDSAEIAEMQEKLSIYDSILKTGNDALDIVLTDKSLYCEKRGIKFTVIADAEKIAFLSDMEIYSIFGNILDNAVEAVLNLPESQRIISLSVKGNGGILSVHSDNYYSSPVKYEDGKIATSKDDKTEHGYGIMSIKRAVEKRGGAVKIKTDENVFSIDIVIPMPKERAAA